MLPFEVMYRNCSYGKSRTVRNKEEGEGEEGRVEDRGGVAEGGDGGRREGGEESGKEDERGGKMWERGRCGKGEVEEEGMGEKYT